MIPAVIVGMAHQDNSPFSAWLLRVHGELQLAGLPPDFLHDTALFRYYVEGRSPETVGRSPAAFTRRS